MHPPGAETVLVRYGEIGVKSTRVQARMEERLATNIEAALDASGLPGRVEREHTRLYVHTATEQIKAVTDRVTEVFGVVSASPAASTEPTLAAIREALASAAREGYDGGSFAVRARRAGNAGAHPFASTDIEREGGAAVWEAAEARGFDPEVDLDAPDCTFFVECRPDRALVFVEKRAGPGGLPLGTQVPFVALISGGIDSPVAAWLAMKRGAPVYPLYVDLGDYGGIDHRMRAVETVARLERFAPGRDMRVRVAPGGEAVEQLVAATDRARMPVWRRFIYRVAEGVAADLGAVGIVTGESIGQKSSQTSANLRVASAATTLPVHRPLLTMDKTEIVDLARDIGTYEESTMDAGCYRLAPENAATRPSLSTVRQVEPDDIEERAEAVAAAVELVEPRESDECATTGERVDVGEPGERAQAPEPGESPE